MPTRRKVSVQIILSLGIIGSAAGLVRLGYYHAYDTDKYPNESLCKIHLLIFPTDKAKPIRGFLTAFIDVDNWGSTILWSLLEAGLGIISCSLPPLRRLFKKFYQGSSGKSDMKSGPGTTDVGTPSLRDALKHC